MGCNEVNRLIVPGIYHNYTGRGWILLFALDKFCAASIAKYRNTGIAFTIAVGINKPSVDAPSAIDEVWALITTPK